MSYTTNFQRPRLPVCGLSGLATRGSPEKDKKWILNIHVFDDTIEADGYKISIFRNHYHL